MNLALPCINVPDPRISPAVFRRGTS
jgi:hypothetical protein